ncbi:hypothetical protein ACP4OV_009118 [Aristida adscensionis]
MGDDGGGGGEWAGCARQPRARLKRKLGCIKLATRMGRRKSSTASMSSVARSGTASSAPSGSATPRPAARRRSTARSRSCSTSPSRELPLLMTSWPCSSTAASCHC